MLDSGGPLIGAVEGLEFASDEITVPPGARLFVYSDGAFEIIRTDGTMWPFAEFVSMLAGAEQDPAEKPPSGRMDALLEHIRNLSGREDFHDDFSMVGLVLG